MKKPVLLFACALAACGTPVTPAPDAGPLDAGEIIDAGMQPDSGTPDAGALVEHGPKQISIDGDPNGLWWDAPSSTLYIADDNNNRVLKYTDAKGIELVGALPAAPAVGTGLGQLVRTADGTIVVVRFGYGTAGDVVFLKPDGTSGVVPNLPVDRRRIGLTVTGDGSLYDCYFVRNANVNVGSVARLDLAGSETEVLGALGKPAGVLAVGTDFFISDQTGNKVLKAPIATPMAAATFATFTAPDLLAAGPNGSLFTGSKTGQVYQISATGQSSVFSDGYREVRGVAWDATNHRIFVADHDGAGLANYLQIIPVP